MGDLLGRLIGQLDTLVPFLAISRKEVFELIGAQWDTWVADAGQSGLPSSYEVYRRQITHSAFLLGYSYFDAFLADLVREVYQARPRMLPKKKQLVYSAVLEAESFQGVLDLMIEREVADLSRKSMKEMAQYFGEKLRIEWPEEPMNQAVEASCLRNCIVHNRARADRRLAEVSCKYKEGEEIDLSDAEVHQHGLLARALARQLHQQARQKHLQAAAP